MGKMKGVAPVEITLKGDHHPCRDQCPFKPEAELRITPVFESLLKAKANYNGFNKR